VVFQGLQVVVLADLRVEGLPDLLAAVAVSVVHHLVEAAVLADLLQAVVVAVAVESVEEDKIFY
jgi:hypothetical protein